MILCWVWYLCKGEYLLTRSDNTRNPHSVKDPQPLLPLLPVSSAHLHLIACERRLVQNPYLYVLFTLFRETGCSIDFAQSGPGLVPLARHAPACKDCLKEPFRG